MKAGLDRQLEANHQYLSLRRQTPHALHLETVFTFNSWAEVLDCGWPDNKQDNHRLVSSAFFMSGVIDVIPGDVFVEQLEKCLQYVDMQLIYV